MADLEAELARFEAEVSGMPSSAGASGQMRPPVSVSIRGWFFSAKPCSCFAFQNLALPLELEVCRLYAYSSAVGTVPEAGFCACLAFHKLSVPRVSMHLHGNH